MDNEQSRREMNEISGIDAGPCHVERESGPAVIQAPLTHHEGDVQGQVCWASFQDSIRLGNKRRRGNEDFHHGGTSESKLLGILLSNIRARDSNENALMCPRAGCYASSTRE
jgi:hypothetical protein